MAKIDARRLGAFLKDPGKTRIVLIHGEDSGLVRERADALQAAIVADKDPFRLAEMPRDAAVKSGALAGEAAALSMTGGRRVIRVRDATDAVAAAAREVLASPAEALVIIEAGELQARSKLRSLLEGEPSAAVIACYRERGADLARTLGEMFREEGVQADPAALDWLAGRLGDDRLQMRREVEKIALYVGAGGTVGEEEVLACVGDGSALEVDEALVAATTGDIPLADRALDSALSEGASPIGVLRSALRHLQRLHLAACGLERGQDIGTAMEALRPPVFGRQRPGFERALRLWSVDRLETALAALQQAEIRAKSGSAARPLPDGAVVRAVMLDIARQAAAGRRGN
jgi:DNA polymerase-3 subunit delta